MKVTHIGKIASVALGIATLSACTTYTGYSSVGYGYNTGYTGYNDYIAPAVIAPPLTVVEPSVIVSRPAPVIVEENRRRGFFSRYDDRRNYNPNYRQDYRHYRGERREDGVRRDGYRQNRPAVSGANGVGVNGLTPQTANQSTTQNRGDWHNRGRYQQANGMNGQPQRQRPTYQRPQRTITPSTTTTTQATPAS